MTGTDNETAVNDFWFSKKNVLLHKLAINWLKEPNTTIALSTRSLWY